MNLSNLFFAKNTAETYTREDLKRHFFQNGH